MADFPQRVQQLLARYADVPTTLLEIEITESAALTDIGPCRPPWSSCATWACRLPSTTSAPGYSSLTYLRQLPADTLKIDRSFVMGMMSDIGDMAIVDGVIGLSRSFGLTLIAEGGDHRAQACACCRWVACWAGAMALPGPCRPRGCRPGPPSGSAPPRPGLRAWRSRGAQDLLGGCRTHIKLMKLWARSGSCPPPPGAIG
jgi:predicted signal transduction protein with EAL and GGDEF domain